MLRHLLHPVHRPAVRRGGDRGVENLLHAVHETRNRGVGALDPALRAAGALLGDELRHLEAHVGHVADGARRRRHDAHRGKRIRNAVLALLAEEADLLPESPGVADPVLRGRHIQGQGDRRHRARPFIADLDSGRVELAQLGESAPDDAQVVFHRAVAQVSELLLELGMKAIEERGLVQPFACRQRRGGKEGAHERRALHAVSELGVRRFVVGDPERVETEQADPPLQDRAPRRCRQRPPQLARLAVALDDEDPTLSQSSQGVRMPEHIRVRREHHVNLLQFAVEPHRLLRENPVEGGGLPLFLRAVFRVGLNVQPEQLEGGHRHVLAHRHRAPAANRVDAEGERPLRQQVHLASGRERQPGQMGISVHELVLPDLELGQLRVFADEIDAQVELPAPGAPRQHVLHGGDDVAGLEVAAAQAKAPGVAVHGLVQRKRRHFRVRQFAAAAAVCPLVARGAAVLGRLRHGCPDLSQ